MGLNTVELVMDVEQTFDIPIPDHEAEQMLSAGLMNEFRRVLKENVISLSV